jgi:2-phospho-L-lactate guanylyltransferase
MAVDTLAALSAALDVVLVVSDQAALQSRLARVGLSVTVVGEPGPVGMNGALSHGARLLGEQGCTLVMACVGDLPALSPGSVRRALAAASRWTRSFVADAPGVGTTMLIARDSVLDPRFQGQSATAHRTSGAVPLTDELLGAPVADARRDVDTELDLTTAYGLGLGRSTAALIDPATGAPGRYDSVTVTAHHDDSADRLVVTSSGHRLVLPTAALQDGLRRPRPGQRLHAVSAAGTVLAAWL